MKIAYYLPSLYAPGGLERVITFKANYFAEHFENYEVYIITSEQINQPIHYQLSPKVKHIDLNTPFDWPFNQSKMKKLLKYPFRYYKFRKRLNAILQEIQPDITISTLRRELNFITKLSDQSIKIGEFHVTRNSYGAGVLDQPSVLTKLLNKLWKKAFDKKTKKLKRLILLTEEEAQYWTHFDNIQVIPNPIITECSAPSDCKSPLVIAAGRYESQKGFDLLIDSWKLVHEKHPDWILRIYGDGKMRSELEEQIERLNLTQSCFLEHTVKNITEKYRESSIFVLSSRYEGFGMVITEAMACGVPPVAFACPCGPRDIITNNVNGLLAEPGNTKDLAQQICNLIEHETKRIEMGKKALERAGDFQISQVSQQWNLLFETLVKENKR